MFNLPDDFYCYFLHFHKNWVWNMILFFATKQNIQRLCLDSLLLSCKLICINHFCDFVTYRVKMFSPKTGHGKTTSVTRTKPHSTGGTK